MRYSCKSRVRHAGRTLLDLDAATRLAYARYRLFLAALNSRPVLPESSLPPESLFEPNIHPREASLESKPLDQHSPAPARIFVDRSEPVRRETSASIF